MSAIYDNWERLVAAVVKKQQLWELCHDYSRSPSILSQASSDLSSSSFISRSRPADDHLPSHDFASRWSSTSTPKLFVVSEFSTFTDFNDIYQHRLQASSEFLGRGTFGSSYTVGKSYGGRIVVKRLNSTSVSEIDFCRHMSIVRGVENENVVALRAYYFSGDERIMLYDYYTKGSVHALLHGGDCVPLDWECRLKIAIGAARGITEIHKQNGGTLVHGNISASNVFINHEQYGCVSDFGLTSMIKTTFNTPAYCYAPEVKNTQSVSQASDVYSFGVLLLELLTRKPAVHVPGGPQAVDLVKLVTSIRNRVRAAKVFDADLLKHPTARDQAVQMLQIGMRCIQKSANQRPKISQVAKMLEDIIGLNQVISRAPAVSGLVLSEDGYPIFGIGNVLVRSSADALGIGKLGTSDDYTVYDLLFTKKMGIDWDWELRTPLVWESLLKISVGAARAIAHIHEQDGQNLVHGNISSSSIRIYRQKYVYVSDAGQAKLSRSEPGKQSPCHRAPEVTNFRSVSQASDIYSFGVVLLELLSGQRPRTTPYDGMVNPFVARFRCVDRTDLPNGEKSTDENVMVELLGIAMYCVSEYPERRPKMSQVVRMLEELSDLNPRLEHLLKDLLSSGCLFTY